VLRPRLFAPLEAGRERTLTLLAAPAGFGKTTLLGLWLQHATRPAAWLTLDADDNEPHLFLRALIMALQTVLPTLGAPILQVLERPEPPPLRALLAALINELTAQDQPLILVLDDYHLITAPAIHQPVTLLLDHLPPKLQVVIATREDPPLPLARWRAQGALIELRASDLRFTPDEAAAFLREVMGLSLAADAVVSLVEHTEGWIAGLQLAALALQGHTDQAAFLAALNSSNRFIVDYLVEEVLRGLPAHLQSFLLQTAILDRLCGPLCDAVLLGTGDWRPEASEDRVIPSLQPPASSLSSYSQLLLEELERRNLFLVPLDNRREWYRYHHLFRDVLRQRLASGASSEAVAALHCCASAWFERHGLTIEAINHRLAAASWEQAAQLLEQHAVAFAARGLIQMALGWLNGLPEPVLHARPQLALDQAHLLMYANQFAAAAERLDTIERELASASDSAHNRYLRGRLMHTRASFCRLRGDLESCVTLEQQVLDLLPEVDAFWRSVAQFNCVQACFVTGDVRAAEQLLEERIAVLRALGTSFSAAIGLAYLAELRVLQGRLHAAAATYAELAQLATGSASQSLVGGAAYWFGMGDLHREWNELETAERELQQGVELLGSGPAADAILVTRGYLALERVQHARGDHSSAHATLDSFLHYARQRDFATHLIARGHAMAARLALAQGDLTTARRWAETSGLNAGDELSDQHEAGYMTLARVWIAQGRGNPAGPYLHDALHLLDQLQAAAEAGERGGSLVEIALLRALALQAQGQVPAALAALDLVLSRAAPEGYVRLFVDEGAPMATLLAQSVERRAQNDSIRAYAERLLAAFPSQQLLETACTADAPPVLRDRPLDRSNALIEPLTEREREVLYLLAAGYATRTIAQQLIISEGTVKRHVSNILGKLGVHSRLEAVAQAHTLGLLT
jgi:LuxR family maltose regulon positive regulatory protein